MEDAFSGLRPVGGPGGPSDPVAEWREEWSRGVAAADDSSPQGDARLAARRRDYGSYLFIALDLLLVILAQLVLSIPLLFLAALLFVATGHNFMDANKISPEFVAWTTAPLFTLIGLIATDGAMVLVVWYRLARQKVSWAMVGLGKGFWRAGQGRVGPVYAVLFGLGVGIVGLVFSGFMDNVLAGLKLDTSAQSRVLIDPLRHTSPAIVFGMVFAGSFVAPAVEELLFRGYIFRALAVRKGLPLAYVVSAALFACFHLLTGLSLWPIVPVLFVIGLLLNYAYHRTGNMLSNYTAHVVNNGAAFALALLLHM